MRIQSKREIDVKCQWAEEGRKGIRMRADPEGMSKEKDESGGNEGVREQQTESRRHGEGRKGRTERI